MPWTSRGWETLDVIEAGGMQWYVQICAQSCCWWLNTWNLSSISASTSVLAYLCGNPLFHKFSQHILAWHNILKEAESQEECIQKMYISSNALNAALCVICRDCRSMVNAPRQTRALVRAKQRPCLAKRSSRIHVTLFVVLHSHTCYTSLLYWRHQTVSFSTQCLL